MTAVELYRDETHEVVMYTDLIAGDGQAVQANQFLICDGDTGAIIDPGGNLAFNELFLNMSKHFMPSKLSYLIASHADPDIIASLDRWMTSTKAKLVISRIWERFAPHFTKVGKTDDRVVGVPDAGGRLPLGSNDLWLLPAHFMHSEGNFHFYDPVSRILFTGDLGVSLMSGKEAQQPITELKPHIARMEGFHRRYMVSNKILRLWVRMARELDISMIVPQHGAPIAGARAIRDFFDWLETLQCGIDLLDEHIGHVAARIKELKVLERQLKTLRETCRESQQASRCGILAGLSTASLRDHGSETSIGHVHGTHSLKGKH